ncbi:unnamed protein product [Leuciscus chuanchicus]
MTESAGLEPLRRGEVSEGLAVPGEGDGWRGDKLSECLTVRLLRRTRPGQMWKSIALTGACHIPSLRADRAFCLIPQCQHSDKQDDICATLFYSGSLCMLEIGRSAQYKGEEEGAGCVGEESNYPHLRGSLRLGPSKGQEALEWLKASWSSHKAFTLASSSQHTYRRNLVKLKKLSSLQHFTQCAPEQGFEVKPSQGQAGALMEAGAGPINKRMASGPALQLLPGEKAPVMEPC